MNNPIISVIIPVYNGEKYIAKCIESLLCQSLRDIEVIVVNDGSKDNSSQIAHALAEKDDRIVVVDKVNEGVSVARNTGIQKSRGQWIAFSDADDYYYPDGLQNLYNAANITGARIILGNADKINIDGKIRQRHDKEKIELRHEYPQCSFEMWGNLYERTLLWEKNHGFQPGLAYFEDRLLQTKMLTQEGCYGICPIPVYAHIENDDSALASKDGLRKAKHIFWSSKLLQEYIEEAPNFRESVVWAHKMVYFAAFRHFVASKNASFGELKRLYLNYYDDIPRFYKSYLKALYQYKKTSLKKEIIKIFRNNDKESSK